MSVKKLVFMSLLTAAALSVYVIENALPPIAPIPAVRLGLANIVTLFALYLGGKWRAQDAAMLLAARLLLGALVTGTTMALLFSAVGGVFAFAAMLLAKKLLHSERALIWAVSVIGAVFHIMGQLLVSVWIYGTSILFYTPVLLISAIVSGAFTGVLITLFFKKMGKLCKAFEEIK